MATITILRALWHRRLLVFGVCLLAGVAGAGITFESHRSQVGLSTERILVDTPNSQIVDLAPKDSGQLGEQTLLLAGLMVDGPIKAVIAQDAGLQPAQISGTSPSLTEAAPTAAPTVASTRPYRLTAQVMTDAAGDDLPIIELDVQAPTTAAATRLANAAVAGVRSYEASTASSEQIATGDRLQITGLGAPQVTSATQGTSPAIAIVAAAVVLLVGCFCVVGIPALARDWRALSARERRERDELLIGHFGALPHGAMFDQSSSPRGPAIGQRPEHERADGQTTADDPAASGQLTDEAASGPARLSETLAHDGS